MQEINQQILHGLPMGPDKQIFCSLPVIIRFSVKNISFWFSKEPFQSLTETDFFNTHSKWFGQEIRELFWNYPFYIWRTCNQQDGSTSTK